MKIKQFKKGDIITRFKPSKGCRDRSYMTCNLVFNKIENGCIFLNRINDVAFNNDELKLECDIWSGGWKLVEAATVVGSLTYELVIDTSALEIPLIKAENGVLKASNEYLRAENKRLIAECKRLKTKLNEIKIKCDS